ncbi:hypothetical protein BCR42DRAFT_332687, partial [Absidia repens]
VLSVVWRYSDLSDEKTVSSFFYQMQKKILDYLPHYQLFIENLKEDGYNLVGYARKSKSNESTESRIRSDLLKNDLLNQLDVDGDTQDMLNYIGRNKNIYLVVLGYADLSTSDKYLETFLR